MRSSDAVLEKIGRPLSAKIARGLALAGLTRGLSIRSAVRNDVPMLARAMVSASRQDRPRGFLDYLLDAPEGEMLRFLENLVGSNVVSPSHYSICRIVERNGKPIGSMGGYDSNERDWRQTHVYAMAEAMGKMGWTPTKMGQIGERTQRFTNCIPGDLPGAFVLHNTARLTTGDRYFAWTVPLLFDFVAIARSRKCAGLQATPLIGNRKQHRALLMLGFHRVDEYRHPDCRVVLGSEGIERLLYDTSTVPRAAEEISDV